MIPEPGAFQAQFGGAAEIGGGDANAQRCREDFAEAPELPE